MLQTLLRSGGFNFTVILSVLKFQPSDSLDIQYKCDNGVPPWSNRLFVFKTGRKQFRPKLNAFID